MEFSLIVEHFLRHSFTYYFPYLRGTVVTDNVSRLEPFDLFSSYTLSRRNMGMKRSFASFFRFGMVSKGDNTKKFFFLWIHLQYSSSERISVTTSAFLTNPQSCRKRMLHITSIRPTVFAMQVRL